MSTPPNQIDYSPYEALLNPPRNDSSDYDSLIEKHAAANDVDPDLVRAVMGQESGGKRRARSNKNAQGLMQLIPATAQRFGVKDTYDPDQNISGGTKYLKFLLDRFSGDIDKTLAGYNAGEGAVDKFNGIPPYRETRNYVKTIRGKYQGAGYHPDNPYAKLLSGQDTASNQPVEAPNQAPEASLSPVAIPTQGRATRPRLAGEVNTAEVPNEQVAPVNPNAKPAPYFTVLAPREERRFQRWVKQNRVPFDPTGESADYDMRGFWKALQAKDPRATTALNSNDGRMHFPDVWKTPYHRSFSNESIYALPTAPRWINDYQQADANGNITFDERVAQRERERVAPDSPLPLSAPDEQVSATFRPGQAYIFGAGDKIPAGRQRRAGDSTQVEASTPDQVTATFTPGQGYLASVTPDEIASGRERTVINAPPQNKDAYLRFIRRNRLQDEFNKMSPEEGYALYNRYQAGDEKVKKNVDNYRRQAKQRDRIARYNEGVEQAQAMRNIEAQGIPSELPDNPSLADLSQSADRATSQNNQVTSLGELQRREGRFGASRTVGIGELRQADNKLIQARDELYKSVGGLRERDEEQIQASRAIRDQIKQGLLSQRAQAAELGNRGVIDSSYANSPLYGMSDKELGIEVEKRAKEVEAQSARDAEIRKLFTPEERTQVARNIKEEGGYGDIRRGATTGFHGIFLTTLDKLGAGAARLMAGLNIPGAKEAEEDYRKRELAFREQSQSVEEQYPLGWKGKTAKFIAGNAPNVLPIAGATALTGGNPIAGFALYNALVATGEGKAPSEVIREGAKGAATGGVFQVGGKLGLFPRVATVGLGTAAIEKAFGASDQDTLGASVTNALFAALSGGDSIQARIGARVRVWWNGKPIADVENTRRGIRLLPPAPEAAEANVEATGKAGDGSFKYKLLNAAPTERQGETVSTPIPQPPSTAPETSVSEQVQAMRSGSQDAVLVPDGQPVPPLMPDEMATKTEIGTIVHPKEIKPRDIRRAVRTNTIDSLIQAQPAEQINSASTPVVPPEQMLRESSSSPVPDTLTKDSRVDEVQKNTVDKLFNESQVQNVAPPAAQTEAVRPETSQKGLTRNFRAGMNNASLIFASQLQKDLYDYGANTATSRGGGQNPRAQAATLGDIKQRLLDSGIPESELYARALDVRNDVKAQMRGVKDGEERKLVDNASVAPAKSESTAEGGGVVPESGKLSPMSDQSPELMSGKEAEGQKQTSVRLLDFKHAEEQTRQERKDDAPFAIFRIQDNRSPLPERSRDYWDTNTEYLEGVSGFGTLLNASRDLLGGKDVDGLGVNYAENVTDAGGEPTLSVFAGTDLGDESPNVNGWSVEPKRETESRFTPDQILQAWKKAVIKEFPSDAESIAKMDFAELDGAYQLEDFDVDAFHALRDIASSKQPTERGAEASPLSKQESTQQAEQPRVIDASPESKERKELSRERGAKYEGAEQRQNEREASELSKARVAVEEAKTKGEKVDEDWIRDRFNVSPEGAKSLLEPAHHSARQLRRVRNTTKGKAGQFKKGVESEPQAGKFSSFMESSQPDESLPIWKRAKLSDTPLRDRQSDVETERGRIIHEPPESFTKGDAIRTARKAADERDTDVLHSAAWHGSPHSFGKFDISKIGVGEGAQVYGHGLYFAEKKEVADYYRHLGNRILVDGEEVRPSKFSPESDSPQKWAKILLANAHGNTPADVISGAIHANKQWLDPKRLDYARFKQAEGILREWEKHGAVRVENKSYLYHVELAPEEDEYLLWDKPMGEQSEKVKASLRDLTDVTHHKDYRQKISELDLGGHGKLWDYSDDSVGLSFKTRAEAEAFAEKARTKDGDEVYRALSDKLGSDKEASAYLHSLGIRGIKYLDGSSRGQGEGSYNYVIFNDEDVSITAVLSKSAQNKAQEFNRVFQLDAHQLAKGAEFISKPRRIYVNPEAQEIIAALDESTQFEGINVSKPRSVSLATQLYNVARQVDRADGQKLRALARAIRYNASTYGTANIITVFNNRGSFAERAAIAHEEIHRWQLALGSDAIDTKLANTEAYKQIQPFLDKHGTNENVYVRLYEAFAHLATEDASKVGVGEDAAREFRRAYLESVKANKGVKVLKEMKYARGETRNIQRELVEGKGKTGGRVGRVSEDRGERGVRGGGGLQGEVNKGQRQVSVLRSPKREERKSEAGFITIPSLNTIGRTAAALNRNALLTLKGFERIALGVGSKQVVDLVGDGIAGIIDAAISRTLSRPRTVGNLTPAALIRASIKGSKLAAKSIGQVARGKETFYAGAEEPTTGAPVLDAAINAMIRLYGSKEAFFRSFAYAKSIETQARMMALNDARAKVIKRSEISARAKEYRTNPPPMVAFNALISAEMARTQLEYETKTGRFKPRDIAQSRKGSVEDRQQTVEDIRAERKLASEARNEVNKAIREANRLARRAKRNPEQKAKAEEAKRNVETVKAKYADAMKELKQARTESTKNYAVDERRAQLASDTKELMNSIALRFSDEQVYAEPSKISDMVRGGIHGIGKVSPEAEIGAKIIQEVYLPFMKRPSNSIVDFLQTYVGAPLNIPVKGVKLLSDIVKGNFSAESQTRFAKSVGRGMAGYSLIGLGMALASIGVMVGGKLLLGGEEWDISRIPFSGWLLTLGSSIYGEGYKGAGKEVAKAVLDHPLLGGLDRLSKDKADVADAAKNFDYKPLERMGQRTGAALLSRAIPSPIAMAAEAMDTQKRDTRGSFMSPTINRIPYLRSDLPSQGEKSNWSIINPFEALPEKGKRKGRSSVVVSGLD